MRYIAAYILAVMGGNQKPSEEDIRTIVSSVGIDIDEMRLKKVLKELHGKDIEELIAFGSQRLATGFVGGGQVTSSVPTQVEEIPKEEEKPVDKGTADDDDSSDEDMGMGLFDM